MKLYEVPRNTTVLLVETGEVFLFDHIDGMYSYCIDSKGNVFHLVAWSEVEIVN
jgi:hypothetical protein